MKDRYFRIYLSFVQTFLNFWLWIYYVTTSQPGIDSHSPNIVSKLKNRIMHLNSISVARNRLQSGEKATTRSIKRSRAYFFVASDDISDLFIFPIKNFSDNQGNVLSIRP